jgi:cation transport ATPase
VLELAGICEQYSNHPIATAINNACKTDTRRDSPGHSTAHP